MSVFDWVLVGVCTVWILVAVYVVVRRRIRRRGCADCGSDCRNCAKRDARRR
ncbi:MAG: hypothetical protein ACI4L9_06465 [Candidatus Coproplasma sp.]